MRTLTFFLTLLFSFSLSSLAIAREVIIPAAPQLSATSYLLIDANSGQVLAENRSETRLPPASITKLMTSYIVSSEIERGAISLDDQVLISLVILAGGKRVSERFSAST